MAPSSSSTRKAARLAQKGKGRRVRFQGGTLFPLVVAIVLVVGLGLVVYARASRPEDVPPRAGDIDHWHGAYAFQLCSDTPNVQLSGTLEEFDADGALIGTDAYLTSGVHSHDDGIIHWHARGSRAMGRNAQLGVFFGNYDVDISNDRLVLPEGGFTMIDGGSVPEDFPLVYEEDETECNGEDATLKVVVWDDASDPNSDQTYTSSFDDIAFDKNGMAFTIAFVPDDVDIEMPPSAANLESLGLEDQPPPQPGETVAPTASTEPGTTEPGGTEPDTTDDGSVATTEAGSEDTAPEATAAEATETTTGSDTSEG